MPRPNGQRLARILGVIVLVLVWTAAAVQYTNTDRFAGRWCLPEYFSPCSPSRVAEPSAKLHNGKPSETQLVPGPGTSCS
jgi:hypothetical protein